MRKELIWVHHPEYVATTCSGGVAVAAVSDGDLQDMAKGSHSQAVFTKGFHGAH
jgi:hypothetical protein